MEKRMTRICTICARGGSKGVPSKNLREIAGKSLVAWSVFHARSSGLFDVIAVSSDDSQILKLAGDAKADLLISRPIELATDTAGKIPAIAHCLAQAEKELGRSAATLVDLDVTSPLRTVADIIAAVDMLEDTNASNVITGTPAHRSPYFNLVEKTSSGAIVLSKAIDRQVLRRQDAPICYDMNASIYVWKRDTFVKNPSVFYEDTQLFEMPAERSLDIDSELDFALVQFLMERYNGHTHE